ncbi:MAG: hypothetical protein SFU99_22780 [Saprospiraceae bacterium]|nr:hypothetical protein [Saprospiraceae bacterium]
MARLTVQDLINAIEKTAEDLLAAAGADGMVSKEDIGKKLQEQQGVQRGLLDAFYDFLREDDQPRMRVTRAVIDDGLAFVKEQLIPKFEIMPGGLSEEESNALSALKAEALILGGRLKQVARGESYLSSKQVFEQIAENAPKLFFDYLGSEGSQAIEAILIPANIINLTKETFAKSLHLNQHSPANYIERFVSAEPFFPIFISQHYPFELGEQATAIVNLMRNNLRQNSIFVTGKDDGNTPPQHPAYIIGIADDGNLVGFKSQVIWT